MDNIKLLTTQAYLIKGNNKLRVTERGYSLSEILGYRALRGTLTLNINGTFINIKDKITKKQIKENYASTK